MLFVKAPYDRSALRRYNLTWRPMPVHIARRSLAEFRLHLPDMKSTATRTVVALLLAGMIVPTIAVADTQTEASRLFDKNCASCHGKDGKAKTFRAVLSKARDLTNAQWQDTITDATIVESIKAGRGKMPAFGKNLSEPQVAVLAQYVRSLKQSSSVPPSRARPDNARSP
jgi:cbb3-type cytochrome c oxidase subunit III